MDRTPTAATLSCMAYLNVVRFEGSHRRCGRVFFGGLAPTTDYHVWTRAMDLKRRPERVIEMRGSMDRWRDGTESAVFPCEEAPPVWPNRRRSKVDSLSPFGFV